jgi:hypothetical protein
VLALAGQHKTNANLSNFLDIIEYWAGDFRAFVVTDQRTDHWHVSRDMGGCGPCGTHGSPQTQIRVL